MWSISDTLDKPISQTFVDAVVAPIRLGPDSRSHYWQLFGHVQRPQGKDDRGKFLFWDIKTASAKLGGKPPPESAPRILASEALNCVTQSSTKKVLLITDGTPCYKSLSAKFGWRQEACNHSKIRKEYFASKRKIKTNWFWFIQEESMQCGGCQRQPFHAV